VVLIHDANERQSMEFSVTQIYVHVTARSSRHDQFLHSPSPSQKHNFSVIFFYQSYEPLSRYETESEMQLIRHATKTILQYAASQLLYNISIHDYTLYGRWVAPLQWNIKILFHIYFKNKSTFCSRKCSKADNPDESEC